MEALEISEQDALTLWSGLNSLPEADKPQAVGILSRYDRQEREAGRVPYASAHATRNKRANDVANYFLKPDHGLGEGLQDFEHALRNTSNIQESKARIFNDEFLALTFGLDSMKISGRRGGYMKEYARQEWDFQEEKIGDLKFAEKVKSQYEFQGLVRAKAMESGMRGDSWVMGMAKSIEEIKKHSGYNPKRDDVLLWNFATDARAMADRLVPYNDSVINPTVQDLKGAMGVDGSASADDAEIVRRVMQVPKQDRDMVLDAIILRGAPGEDKKGAAQKLAERFGRGVQDFALGLPTAGGITNMVIARDQAKGAFIPVDSTDPVGDAITDSFKPLILGASEIAGIEAIGQKRRPLTAEEKKKVDDAFALGIEGVQLWQRIDDIARDKIDPATSDYAPARGLYNAAQSVPMTIAAFVPGAQIFMAGQFANDNLKELDRTFPKMDLRQKLAISITSSPVQAFTEIASDRFLLGRLPNLTKILRAPVATWGGLATRMAATVPLGMVTETVEEIAQDVTPYALTEVIGALQKDMPKVPWTDIGKGIDANKWDLFWSILPMVATMSGGANIIDFKNGRQLASNEQALLSSGLSIDSAKAISQAAKSGDWQKAQGLMREEWNKGRVQTDGAALEAVRTEYAQAQRAEASAQLSAVAHLETAGILPTVRQVEQGKWRVEMRDEGSTFVDFSTFQEANDARFEVAEQRNIDLHETVRGYITKADQNLAVGRAYDYEFSAERDSLGRAVDDGHVTREAAERRVDIREETETSKKPGQEEDTDFDAATAAITVTAETMDDRLAAAQILGENKTTFKDGVYRTAIKLNSGFTAQTVVEEKVEGDADVMIAKGRRDWMVEKLRSYEALSGDKIFRTGDDSKLTNDDVREAWSHFAVSYLSGKSKTDQKLPDAWKAKGFRRVIADTIRSGMGGVMTGYSTFFNSVFRRAAKIKKLQRAGGLDADFETEIARSLGLEQRVHEAGVANEAAELAEEFQQPELSPGEELDGDNAPFAILPLGPGNRRISSAPKVLEQKPSPFTDDRAGTDANRWRAAWKDWLTDNRSTWRQTVDLPEGPVTISAKTEKEVGQFKRSENIGYHFEAAARLPELLQNSALAAVEPYKGPEAAAEIHKRYAWMKMSDGSRRHVMMTVIRWTGEKVTTDSAYSVEAIEVQNNSPTVQTRAAGEIESTPSVSERKTLPTRSDSEATLQTFLSGIKPEHRLGSSAGMSVVSGELDKRLAAMFDPFQRSPELRGKLQMEMKRRVDNVRKSRDAMIGGRPIRIEGLDEIAGKNWVANRAQEITDAELQKLAPEVLAAAYSDSSLSNAKAQPVIAAMLRNGKGRLAHPSKAGQAINEYDDMPTGLPVWFFGGSLHPDQMAQELYDTGLIASPDATAMWSAVESSFVTAAQTKQAVQSARQKVKAVELAARQQARKDAESSPQFHSEQRQKLRAWLKTLDAILSAVPAEVRAKVGGYVKLASLTTDKQMLGEIDRRVAKLDEELEKYMQKDFRSQIEKALDRYTSQRSDAGQMRGKLVSTYTEQVDYAEKVVGMSKEDQDKETALLEKTISESEDSNAVQDAVNKLGIAELFYDFKNLDAEQLDRANKWLKDTIETGKESKKILDEARREKIADLKKDGKANVLQGADASLVEAENLEGQTKGKWWRTMVDNVKGAVSSVMWTATQQLELTFGQDSKLTEEFTGRIIVAANLSIDIKRDVERQRVAKMREIFGTQSTWKLITKLAKLQQGKESGVIINKGRITEEVVLTEEILERLNDGAITPQSIGLEDHQAQDALDKWAASPNTTTVIAEKTVNAGRDVGVFMSEMDAVQYLMSWNQADVRKRMERHGWSEASMDQVKAFISPEAAAIGQWMSEMYEKGAQLIDPVYRRIFNAPLPRVKNYAPTVYNISGSDNITGPDQQQMSSSMSASFTKARRSHNAELRRADALSTFLQHWEHVSHWVAYAEIVRDMKAVLTDTEVQNAIRSKGGAQSAQLLKTRVKQIEAMGNNSAWSLSTLDSFMHRFNQWRAFKGLAFRISPVAKQTSAILNPLLADIPAHSYAVGLAKALAGKLDVKEMWKSDAIQRRIEAGFSPEARLALSNMSAGQSGPVGQTLVALMQKGMLPMQLTDAGWTSVGAAIGYDFYRSQALESGATEEIAHESALRSVDRMIATSAQPVDAVHRSLSEGDSSPFKRTLWMFASESRKTLAIEMMAIHRLASGRSKNKALDVQRAVVAHVMMASVTQLMSAMLASLIGDDDDAEREWSLKAWTAAILAGPINGIFLFGDAVNYGARRLVGARAFLATSPTAKLAADFTESLMGIGDIFNSEEDGVDALYKLSDSVGGVVGTVVGPAAAAPFVILGNSLKEAEKVLSDE